MKRSLAAMMVIAWLATAAMAQESLSLPAGTGVRMKLETPISTHTSKAGDVFSGRVTEAVEVGGRTVIPVGAAIQGRVTKLTEPRRVRGTPEIDLRPEQLTMPNGEHYTISAVVVDTDKASHTSVNDEGNIHGRGRSGKDNREMIIGTGAGLTVGALAGGGKGALVGATLGATVTGARWMSRKHSAELPAGSEIVLEFSRPMAMTVASSGQ